MYLCSCVALQRDRLKPARSSPAFYEATGPCHFVRQASFLALGAGAFMLAACLRSNGALLAAFIPYAVACELRRQGGPRVRIALWVSWIAVTCVAVAIVALPYVAFQWYGFYLYCSSAPPWLRNLAHVVAGLSLPIEPANPIRPWCSPLVGGELPRMYGFVQAEYWGVGPLKYFQPKQIPQFILAAPMIALAATCAWQLFSTSLYIASHEVASLILALLGPISPLKVEGPLETLHARRGGQAQLPGWMQSSPLSRPESLPFVLYWIGLVGVGVVVMHVQVVSAEACVCRLPNHLRRILSNPLADYTICRCQPCIVLVSCAALGIPQSC